jgi:hypothetical protein
VVRQPAPETAGFSRSQPDWIWLYEPFSAQHAVVVQLEGLVPLTGRDGSTPFSRTRKPPHSGGFRVVERLSGLAPIRHRMPKHGSRCAGLVTEGVECGSSARRRLNAPS